MEYDLHKYMLVQNQKKNEEVNNPDNSSKIEELIQYLKTTPKKEKEKSFDELSLEEALSK